jgi:Bacteriophage Sf6, terminase small subunit-like
MKRGRKSKLIPALRTRICTLLAQGRTIKTVCEAVGIAERTYFDWCEKHLHFSQATTCAIGKSKIALVNNLRRSDDWRASAFLLERRFPREFGRVDVRELPVVQDEKRINVAFILSEPDGKQRQISWERAKAIGQLPPVNQADDQSYAERTPLDGSHATEPNGEQPLP